jgi:sialate O-acetylesterase
VAAVAAGVLTAMLAVAPASAAIRLPKVIGDNMVLQREMPVPIWGWATAGQKVTVTFAGQDKSVTAGADGKWTVKLDALKASAEPATMTIAAGDADKVELKNILVGEVWLGSGQSNMEMNVGGCLEAGKFIQAAKYPNIRLFTVDKRPAGEAVADVPSRGWEECQPKNVGGFSAVLYFFGQRIHKDLNVPVGLIHSSWGGTAIEPWIAPCGFEAIPSLAPFVKRIQDAPAEYRKSVTDTLARIEAWVPTAKEALANSAPLPPAPFLKRAKDAPAESGKAAAETLARIEAWLPKAKAAVAANAPIPPAPEMPKHPLDSPGGTTGLYNGMIHGLIPYGVRGMLWYQGESNGGEAYSYFEKMKALIGGWRHLWGQGDFPFYFVQLANFMAANTNPEGGDGWSKLRESQLMSLAIANTGMAVLTDIGDAKDIHPKDKQDVGERLALWALAKDYGKKDLVYSGPLYKSAKVDGATMVISFDCVGTGLMVGQKEGLAPTKELPDGKLHGFAIQGDDGKWHWADAKIVGQTVVVSSPDVTAPKAVRYEFHTNTDGANFYNKEGLPASPFRTDIEKEYLAK